MNRETETHFSLLPQVEKPRSIFDRSNQVKTSFNVGDLVPIEVWQDVMPGDTIQQSTAAVIRYTSSFIKPVMDNSYLDIFYFFVPNRLSMTDYNKFMGENDDPWITNQTEMKILTINAPTSTGWTEGTLADYMGLPTKVAGIEVSRLPFNAYCKIYNDHFRDQNVQYALDMDTTTQTKNGSNGSTAITDCCLGGKPAKANKFHDYFTSCLPGALKHAPVKLPLGTTAPVLGNGIALGLTDGTNSHGIIENNSNNITSAQNTLGKVVGTTYSGNTGIFTNDKALGVVKDGTKSGLIADLSNATAATISQLYQAFALQSLYQAEARSGSRLNELIYGHFGVKSADARLQRAEYLGGKRIALNTQQVENTASNLATLGAYSLTTDKEEDMFTYSATEWGILMCLACVRAEHSYQQGIERAWSRFYKVDNYFPELANIAEQLVLNKEIYAQGSSVTDTDGNVVDEQGFGYQEPWADLRFKQSRVSSSMRSNATGTLDVYHYADNYASLPYLSATWMEEPTTNVDRTLSVTSATSNQIIGDFYFDSKWTRVMPLYSIPGLKA